MSNAAVKLEVTSRAPEPIFVTRPFLPPLEELVPLLQEIWSRQLLTNNGPLHERLEHRLTETLGVEQISLVANGSLALMVALQSAGMTCGEVITTPYSFVATSHIPKLLSLTPVFVDIRPDDFNMNPDLIEAAITPQTCAILPVHTYGFPCDSEAIDAIGKRHSLTVIYDAAHAFGVTKNGSSILRSGDFSALSFHATKAFNTFEGGAVVMSSADAKLRVDRMKNFGFRDETTVESVGGNAKMSEFNAALGLLQLNHFEAVRAARRAVDERYRKAFSGIEGILCPEIPLGVNHNYSYFPILVQRGYPLSRDLLFARLRKFGIMARRYFYPLISSFPMYVTAPSASISNIPVATRVAEEILCLPIYPDLSCDDQARVIELIVSSG